MLSDNQPLDKRLTPATTLPPSDLPTTAQPTTADSVADGHEVPEVRDIRTERIQQFVNDSLHQVDPLEAALGAACGDLLQVQYRLRQALDETLQQPPDSLTALAEVLPALNTFMKVNQQVGQYVQLKLKVRAAQARSQDYYELAVADPG